MAPTGSIPPKGWGWRPWLVFLGVIVVLEVLGFGAGLLLLNAANQHQSCAPRAQSTSWKGIQVSGVPNELQTSFGYGRGTETIESVLTATSQSALPASLELFAEPLMTSDGSQLIPSSSLPTKGLNVGQGEVSAVATRIASSSSYQLEVCITAPRTAAGSYTGDLLFPGASLASGTSLPVTVTLQTRLVPFVLTMGGTLLALLGTVYITILLLRRSDPKLKIKGLARQVYDELWTVNGLVAAIVALGAVFTAWSAQCYRNPTWGSPWPTILVTAATLAGAAAAAATVPMGLAKTSQSSDASQ